MILKKFFGKTIEMAKKSARQMYGEDIVIMESFNADGRNDAGVTILVDSSATPQKTAREDNGEQTRFRNVFYKRSDMAAASTQGRAEQETETESRPARQNDFSRTFETAGTVENRKTDASRNASKGHHNRFAESPPPEKISNNLKALREYARKEMGSEQNGQGRTASEHQNGSAQKREEPDRQSQKTRFRPGAGTGNLRGFRRDKASVSTREEGSGQAEAENLPSTNTATSFKNGNRESDSLSSAQKAETFTPKAEHNTPESNTTPDTSAEAPVWKSRFRPSDPADASARDTASLAAKSQREVSALHKRFDKLEALLDSALISSNLDYASHPAFQQLVQTGIKPTIIARWFREIIEKGIDADDEPQQFMSELSAIIRNALKGDASPDPAKYMLFTGPSGSGKTHLIMKLLLHPGFMSGKQIAVVSLLPPDQSKQPYYTVLKPFCDDHGISYFTAEKPADVTKQLQSWETFDHVLFDSPAIPVEQDSSFRQYWKMRQLLASVTPLEVHYVVNASLNRYYFRNSGSVHHPLQPDFVAITHLDEVSEWGPIIPFMEDMGCGARYISKGASIPDGLAEFSPTWFAQQVLQDT